MVLTNRKLGARGGALVFQRLKRDILRLINGDHDPKARFSTMVDLYALPSDYPGWIEARKQSRPIDRVQALEEALANEIPDPRFLPYLQLHEFEALLYCDLQELASRIEDSTQSIAKLQAEVAQFASPEDINEGDTTAPSKRLIKHIPRYEKLKVRVGAPAAGAIGLNKLRSRCPHFGQWLTHLENLQ